MCVCLSLGHYTASSFIQSFSKGKLSRYAAMLEIGNGRLAVIITIIISKFAKLPTNISGSF